MGPVETGEIQMSACKGMNCGCTDGNHSPECRAEHAASAAGGTFIPGRAIKAGRKIPVFGEDGGVWSFCSPLDSFPRETVMYAVIPRGEK